MDEPHTSELDIRILSEQRFFQGESPMTLAWLLKVSQLRTLKAGEVLLHANRHNDFLYLVLDGLFRVELEADSGQVVTHIEPGETIGELSALDGMPTAASVIADQASRVLAIQRVDLWELIARSHSVARNMLQLLVSRIRKDDEVLNNSFALQRKYAYTARMDSLTGLYNRYWMNEMLPRVLERAQTNHEPFGLLMLDVDHFKNYNDNFGHQAGDEVLRAVGAIMLRHIRADDSAVRYGGEEFVIILPGLSRSSVEEIAQRLCQAIREESINMFRAQQLPGVTISIGVAMLAENLGIDELLANADRALYQAKAEGRDRVVVA